MSEKYRQRPGGRWNGRHLRVSHGWISDHRFVAVAGKTKHLVNVSDIQPFCRDLNRTLDFLVIQKFPQRLRACVANHDTTQFVGGVGRDDLHVTAKIPSAPCSRAAIASDLESPGIKRWRGRSPRYQVTQYPGRL